MQRCTVSSSFFRGETPPHPPYMEVGFNLIATRPPCQDPTSTPVSTCYFVLEVLELWHVCFSTYHKSLRNNKVTSSIISQIPPLWLFTKDFWKCNLFPTHCGSDRSAFHNGQPQNYFTVLLGDHEGYISDRKFIGTCSSLTIAVLTVVNFVLDIYEPPTWLNSTKYCTCTSL